MRMRDIAEEAPGLSRCFSRARFQAVVFKLLFSPSYRCPDRRLQIIRGVGFVSALGSLMPACRHHDLTLLLPAIGRCGNDLGDDLELPAAGTDFLDLAVELSDQHIVRRDGNDRHIAVR